MRVEWFVLVLRELKLVKVPGQTDGGFFGRSFPPRIFTVSIFYGQCNSYITALLLIVKSVFGTACIHLFFPLHHLVNGTLESFHSYL